MYDVQEKDDDLYIHGHMTPEQVVTIGILLVFFWPLGLYYWQSYSKEADYKACEQYERDQARR